jgi:hypothetical protein
VAETTVAIDLSTTEGEKQAFCNLDGVLPLNDDVCIAGGLFIGSTLSDNIAEADEFQADRTNA